MERRSIESIAKALNEADARYLIVGGVAVVAHGFVRFTADVDLVLDPDPVALRRAIAAISALGYRSRAPVPLEQFADPVRRAEWAVQKGLTVFSLFSPEHVATELDLFLECPFDFEAAYGRALRRESGGVPLTFVGLHELLALKRGAGRPQDLVDVAQLEALEQRKEPGDGT